MEALKHNSKSVYDAAVEMYPILEEYPYTVVETPDKNSPYYLEHFSPEETDSPEYPRPDGIPIDEYGLQIFKDVKPEDVAGDIISHHLVNADEILSKKYQRFKDVVPLETMVSRYNYHKENLGEERNFNDWVERTGYPELFRGYVFNQFDEKTKNKIYTPEQIEVLDDIKEYITKTDDVLEYNQGGTVEKNPYVSEKDLQEFKSLGEQMRGITAKDVASTVADFTPIVGEIKGGVEGAMLIQEELERENPNYYLIGAIGGMTAAASIIGLVPWVGDAGQKAIMHGAKMAAKKARKDPSKATREELDPQQLYKTKPDTYVDEIPVESREVKDLNISPKKDISIEDLQGKTIIGTQGDRVDIGREVTGIRGQVLDEPVRLHGGRGFMREPPYLWASDQKYVRDIAKTAQEVKEKTGEDPLLGYISMAGQSGDFSTDMSDTVMELVKNAKISKKNAKEFDSWVINNVDPNWTGIKNPITKQYLKNNLSGSKRRVLWQELNRNYWTEKGFPNMGDARVAITDPNLLMSPSMEMSTFGKLDSSGRVLTSPQQYHPSYASVVEGVYEGDLLEGVPAKILLRNFFTNRRADETAKLSSDQRSLMMSGRGDVTETVDQQMIDEAMQFLDLEERVARENFLRDLDKLRTPKTSVTTDKQTKDVFNRPEAVPAGEIGASPFHLNNNLFKNYTKKDIIEADELVKNSGKSSAGGKERDLKIYTPIEEGTDTAIRLNLSSRIDNTIKETKEKPNLWNRLQTIHPVNIKGSKKEVDYGSSLSYMPWATVKNGTFDVDKVGRRKIKETGKKGAAASITGTFTSRNVLDEMDDTVVEIGFNPNMHHLFVDMQNGQAVKSFEIATAFRDRVYAKGVTYWKKTDAPEPLKAIKDGSELPSEVRYKFNQGGAVMQDQMKMAFMDEGGLKDEGGQVEPTSGNEVPSGSLKEEVKDDVPTMLSEGEFVFPADVVRYIGLEKLMMMRQEAKMGLKRMEAMGQMGNSDEATIPDDLPFGMSDLVVISGGKDEPKEMAEGGVLTGQQGLFADPRFANQMQSNVPTYTASDADKVKSDVSQGLSPQANVRIYVDKDGNKVNVPFYGDTPQMDLTGLTPLKTSEDLQEKAKEEQKELVDPRDEVRRDPLMVGYKTEDRGLAKPFSEYTAEDFGKSAASYEGPLAEAAGFTPLSILGGLSLDAGKPIAEAMLNAKGPDGDNSLTDFEILSLKRYNDVKRPENFITNVINKIKGLGQEDESVDETQEIISYVDKNGEEVKGTYDQLLKKYLDDFKASKKVVPQVRDQLSDIAGEKGVAQRQFEDSGFTLTNYGNIMYRPTGTGSRDMDFIQFDVEGVGRKLYRIGELKKALGKSTLTSSDLLSLDPNKLRETIEGKGILGETKRSVTYGDADKNTDKNNIVPPPPEKSPKVNLAPETAENLGIKPIGERETKAEKDARQDRIDKNVAAWKAKQGTMNVEGKQIATNKKKPTDKEEATAIGQATGKGYIGGSGFKKGGLASIKTKPTIKRKGGLTSKKK